MPLYPLDPIYRERLSPAERLNDMRHPIIHVKSERYQKARIFKIIAKFGPLNRAFSA